MVAYDLATVRINGDSCGAGVDTDLVMPSQRSE